MTNKIGRFEILSEITHSEIGAVYKAADPESGQTIALKTIRLQMLDEQADVLVDTILQEAAGTKPLSSHNIAQLFGVEVIDDQCCASEEYVQGNSIATMLARNEGFSIWDLQDIVRQTCQGLDHAHSHNVVHYSLEPAKIMVTWDGTVKGPELRCFLHGSVYLSGFGQGAGRSALRFAGTVAWRSGGWPLQHLQPGRDPVRDGHREQGLSRRRCGPGAAWDCRSDARCSHSRSIARFIPC